MSRERERHTVYLSDLVWADLRRYVILQAGKDASAEIERQLDAWLSNAAQLAIPSRRSQDDGIDTPGKRTIYLRPGLWDEISRQAKAGGYSPSMLIETLLVRAFGGKTKSKNPTPGPSPRAGRGER
jgi:hypothetical protein